MKIASFWIVTAPLVFFQLYLSGTVLLFAFGPWQWYVPTPWKLYSFLFAAQLFILLGYLAAVYLEGDVKPALRARNFGLKWFYVSLAISIIFALPSSYARTDSYIPDIISGIFKPGIVYMENYERLSKGGPHLVVEYAKILISFISLSLFPLAVLYWRNIGFFSRILATIAIAFYLFITIASGQNRGMAEIIATIGFLVIAASSAQGVTVKGALVKSSLFQFVGLVFFFIYFGMTQLLRRGGAAANEAGSFGWKTSTPTSAAASEAGTAAYGGVATSGSGIASTAADAATSGSEALTVVPPNFTPDVVVANHDHILSQILPDFARTTFESFARYLGQGYQALVLCFDIQHPLTWGVGNSMFFARNFDRVLGTDFFVKESLPGILQSQTGWSMFNLWHSIYPWLASDFGFFGTLIVMMFLGFLLARAWMRTISTLDPIWGTILYLLLIAFFYIPGNNQLMQSGETAVAIVVLVALVIFRGMYGMFKRRSTSSSTT